MSSNRIVRHRRMAAVTLVACLATVIATALPASASSQSISPTALATAKAALSPYENHPSAFPATVALVKKPPAGTKFVYLQCAAPTCAQLGKLLVAPVKAIGGTLTVVDSGLTATSSQQAAATAIADKPAAVLITAVAPQVFGGALHQLVSAGVAVTGVGVVDGKPYGVQESIGDSSSDVTAGKLMADWVAVNKGTKANVVFFGAPELAFTPLMEKGFTTQMATSCPSCKVDTQPLSVLTFGTTAPAAVVSYLQAHPEVNTVVFGTMEAATGLAAALKDANMHVTTLGFAPTASNLQDIKDGGLTAALGVDTNVEAWTMVDVTARRLAHQKVLPAELSTDLEFLTQKNVTTANATNGWTGYPTVAHRFAVLWNPSK